MASPVFGITPDEVAKDWNGLEIDSTETDPNTAEAQVMIDEEESRVTAVYYGMLGVDPTSLAVSSHGFVTGKRIAKKFALVRLLRAREQDLEPADRMYQEAERELNGLEKKKGRLGNSQSTAVDAPGVVSSHVTRADRIEAARADNPRTRWENMRARREF